MECSEKVWNMLSVPHCMPLAFSPQSIYLGSENRGSRFNVVAFCAGTRLGRGAEERTYGSWDMGGGKLACAHGGSRMSISQNPPPLLTRRDGAMTTGIHSPPVPPPYLAPCV